jgi:hypothetical protein
MTIARAGESGKRVVVELVGEMPCLNRHWTCPLGFGHFPRWMRDLSLLSAFLFKGLENTIDEFL